MSIIIRRALMRELGGWATQPAGKVAGVVFAFAAVIGALWLTKFLLDSGSLVAAFERLKDILSLRLREVS